MFPQQKWLRSFDQQHIEVRRSELEKYLNDIYQLRKEDVLSNPEEIAYDPLYSFLRGKPFVAKGITFQPVRRNC